MTLFSYKAIDELGSVVSGEIEAESKVMAMEMIAADGHIPESLKRKKKSAATTAGKYQFLNKLLTPVRSKDIILFTMQFRTLLMSGISILQIFKILEEQTENAKLSNICNLMQKRIQEGSTLYDAFSRHSSVFSNLYCTLIRAGELSGALPNTLERLIYIMEHENKIKSDIQSAIRYPIIVVLFLFIAFLVLLTFVVPQFAKLFQDAGIDLPLPTKICMVLYFTLSHYWPYILGVLLVGGIGIFQFLQTHRGQYFKDVILMKLPVIGQLLMKISMSRFASIFAILQSSGITILESLNILSSTLNNKAIGEEFDKMHGQLVEGRGIAAPLEKAKFFPSMVVNMIAIGEQSGSLDDTLSEISKHYDIEVEYAAKTFSETLGPVLIVGLAAVVGFFAFAIFMPMWDLTKMVK